MIYFTIVGVMVAIVGLFLVVTAIRHQHEQRPRYAAMLIGGMMFTAFGILIAGFSFAYEHSPPLDLNAAAPN